MLHLYVPRPDHSILLFTLPDRPWLRKGEEHMVQRFDPVGPRDTIGFFIAKFSVAAH